MRLITVFIFSLLFSSFAYSASGQLKPYKGALKNPEFSLQDIKGKTHKLSDYKGEIVLLQFWATYCTPCRKEMPTMNKLIKKMAGKPFKILTINMAEDEKTIKQFMQEVPMDFTVLLDKSGTTIGQWNVFVAPANFILDKNGKILFTLYGAIEWDSPKMVKIMTTLSEQ